MTIHITVVTHPVANVQQRLVSVGTDVKLVKAALLYADKVSLLSPTASMLTAIEQFASITPSNQFAVMLELMDATHLHGITHDQLMNIRLHLAERDGLRRKGKKGRRQNETVRLGQLDSVVAQAEVSIRSIWSEQLAPTIEVAIDKAGLRDLEPAITAGLLDVIPLAVGGKEDSTSDALSADLLLRLRDLLAGLESFPLVDDRMGQLVRSGIREGLFQRSEFQDGQAREAIVGAGLAQRLPAFVEPPMSEIIDIRSELQPALVRYRTAVAEMAIALDAGPFDEDMTHLIDRLYRTKVDPALMEIAEALRDARYRSIVTDQMRDQLDAILLGIASGVTAAAVLSMKVAGIDQTDDLPTILAHAVGATPVAISAAPILGAMGKAKGRQARAKAEIRKQSLYFLYQTNERLSNH